MKRHRLYLFLFAVVYVLGFAGALPFFIDEAYTQHLATDHSLAHMLSALRQGADGTLPLFGTLAFGWARIFGASEWALRLTGGLFVVLLVVHSGDHLRRYFSPWLVTLALLAVLANHRFLQSTVQARGYGMLLFAFSLCFWSTWGLIEAKALPRAHWWRHALYCGLLWLSHPLGMVYGSILTGLYFGFSAVRKTFSWPNLMAFAGGPILFLPWLPSFLIQRQINVDFPPDLHLPGLKKYWDYAFLESPIFFVLTLLGTLVLVTSMWRTSTREMPPAPEPFTRSARRHLMLYALAFIVLLNVAIAVLDGTGVIAVYLMLAIRYALVAVVAFAVLFSGIIEGLEKCAVALGRSFPPKQILATLRVLIAAFLFFQMQRLWTDAWRIKSTREPYLNSVAGLAKEKHLDILCENHIDAFFLQTRTEAPSVKYVLEEDYGYRTFMRQHHRFYPAPEPISPADARRYPDDCVFVPTGGTAFILKKADSRLPK